MEFGMNPVIWLYRRLINFNRYGSISPGSGSWKIQGGDRLQPSYRRRSLCISCLLGCCWGRRYNQTRLGDDIGRFLAPLLMKTIHLSMQALLLNASTCFNSPMFQSSLCMRRLLHERRKEMEEKFKATSSIEQGRQNTFKTGCVLQNLEKKMEIIKLNRAEAIGESMWTIFRFPKPLKGIKMKAWQPEMAIIGPYHRDDNLIKNTMIEGQKVQYLKSMVERTEKEEGFGLDKFVDAIKEVVEDARLCYSELHKKMEDEDFTEMLILDGCFLIELFIRNKKLEERNEKLEESEKEVDPIFKMPYIKPILSRDLLKLENQIPFFVLQRLFELSRLQFHVGVPLKNLAIKFFNKALEASKYELLECQEEDYQHLLDLFLSCFTSQFQTPQDKHVMDVQDLPPVQMIQCVRKLRDSKVKFKLKEGIPHNFLDITFKPHCFRGVLEIPPLVIDDFTGCVFLNAIAYEQCLGVGSRHITSYAAFIDCLIDTPVDVGFLFEDKIITRISGNEKNVADFFNALGKAIVHDPNNCYLSDQFSKVDKYYRSWWPTMMRTYFRTPWSFLSASSAVLLLLLTMAQTLVSILTYFRL